MNQENRGTGEAGSRWDDMDGSCKKGLEMLTSGVFLHWVTVEYVP